MPAVRTETQGTCINYRFTIANQAFANNALGRIQT